VFQDEGVQQHQSVRAVIARTGHSRNAKARRAEPLPPLNPFDKNTRAISTRSFHQSKGGKPPAAGSLPVKLPRRGGAYEGQSGNGALHRGKSEGIRSVRRQITFASNSTNRCKSSLPMPGFTVFPDFAQ
jgi:hypothetical protein